MSRTESADAASTPGPAVVVRRTLDNIGGGFAGLLRPPRAMLGVRAPQIEARFAAAAVLMVMVAAAWQMVLFDTSAAAAVRHLPQWLVRTLDEMTDFGRSSVFLWPIAIVLLELAVIAALESRRLNRLVVAALSVRLSYIFLAIGLPGLFVAIVKRLIGRVRPPVDGRIGDTFTYEPFAWKIASASMPSGHATTAFAAAFAIGSLWPGARPYLVVYAVVIAISRVAISAHYPSDVLVGAAVGLAGAYLVRRSFAVRGLAFAVTDKGEVRAKPGPSWRHVRRIARGAFR